MTHKRSSCSWYCLNAGCGNHSELIMSIFFILLVRKDGKRRNSVENKDGGHTTDSGFSFFFLYLFLLPTWTRLCLFMIGQNYFKCHLSGFTCSSQPSSPSVPSDYFILSWLNNRATPFLVLNLVIHSRTSIEISTITQHHSRHCGQHREQKRQRY